MYDIKVREAVVCVREQFPGHMAYPYRRLSIYYTVKKREQKNGENVSFATS